MQGISVADISGKKVSEVEIYDVFGKRIKQADINSGESLFLLESSKFRNGIYYLKAFSESGQIFGGKFIVLKKLI